MIPTWVWALPMGLISEISAQHNVERELIAAIVYAESRGVPCAQRYEPDYKWLFNPRKWSRSLLISDKTETINQKTSFGLMQIMLSTARQLGFNGYAVELCDPRIGLIWGIKYLKEHLVSYDSIDDAVSAYNAGSPRKDKDGKYSNQEYVDRVMELYRQLTHEESSNRSGDVSGPYRVSHSTK